MHFSGCDFEIPRIPISFVPAHFEASGLRRHVRYRILVRWDINEATYAAAAWQRLDQSCRSRGKPLKNPALKLIILHPINSLHSLAAVVSRKMMKIRRRFFGTDGIRRLNRYAEHFSPIHASGKCGGDGPLSRHNSEQGRL